jgi:hypothetical protein
MVGDMEIKGKRRKNMNSHLLIVEIALLRFRAPTWKMAF